MAADGSRLRNVARPACPTVRCWLGGRSTREERHGWEILSGTRRRLSLTPPLRHPHPTTQPARLSIVREIPAQHDGLLESRRSEQQAGTCIRPSLPKKRTHHDESSPKKAREKQTCLQMVGTMTRSAGQLDGHTICLSRLVATSYFLRR